MNAVPIITDVVPTEITGTFAKVYAVPTEMELPTDTPPVSVTKIIVFPTPTSCDIVVCKNVEFEKYFDGAIVAIPTTAKSD